MRKNYIKAISGIFFSIEILIAATTQGQIINTFAGNGTQSYSGDGGPSTIAALNYPFAACVDDSGNVYIADVNNNRIRKVNAYTDIITTVAGNGNQGYSGDGLAATAAELNRPEGIALDTAGNLYISDSYNYVIRKLTKSTGIITTIAGNGGYGSGGDGGPATNASFATPIGVAVDIPGNVYISDHYNGRIRKVTAATGIINTIVGGGSNAGSDGVGDNGPGTGAQLNQADGIVVDDSGNVFIADQWNNRIRKFIAKTDTIICVAGNGSFGYSGDGGLATSAELDICSGVAVDGSGNIYIADTYNNEIRKVTKSTNIITTIAGYINSYQGTGNGIYSGDGGPATDAQLNQPYDVTVDACGNVYSVETSSGGQIDNRVRIIYIPDSVKVSPNPATSCSGGGITLHASGANYYKWSPSTGLSDTTGDTVIASPTIATTYTLTGGNGCAGGVTFVPATVAVTIGIAPQLTITQQPPQSTCNGQPVTLFVSGGGSNFTWSPSMGLSATTGSSVIATPSDTTIYTVSGTISGGCTSIGADTVNIIAASSLYIQPSSTSICPGTSIVLTVPVSGTDYIWSPASSLNPSIGDTVTAMPSAQTIYTVTGVDSLGCSVTASDTISISQAPNKSTISIDGNDLVSSATQGNQWLRNDTVIQGATNQTYAANTGGYYQVIASNPANGCSTESDSTLATGINQLTIESGQLTVYPNPTEGKIMVNINSSAMDVENWNLEIYDVLGRAVYTKTSLNYTNDIDLSNLAVGVYFITIINKTSRTVFPIVKLN